MSNKTRGFVNYVLAMVLLSIFLTNGEIEAAVFAIIFTVVGAESNIISIIEKDADAK